MSSMRRSDPRYLSRSSKVVAPSPSTASPVKSAPSSSIRKEAWSSVCPGVAMHRTVAPIVSKTWPSWSSLMPFGSSLPGVRIIYTGTHLPKASRTSVSEHVICIYVRTKRRKEKNEWRFVFVHTHTHRGRAMYIVSIYIHMHVIGRGTHMKRPATTRSKTTTTCMLS